MPNNPANNLKSVDFPDPFGPLTKQIDPGITEKLILENIKFSPRLHAKDCPVNVILKTFEVLTFRLILFDI